MLDAMREEFARHLATDPAGRWRMDAALAHVVALAYQQGLADGATAPPQASQAVEKVAA